MNQTISLPGLSLGSYQGPGNFSYLAAQIASHAETRDRTGELQIFNFAFPTELSRLNEFDDQPNSKQSNNVPATSFPARSGPAIES